MQPPADESAILSTAQYAAEQCVRVFRAHDERRREEAIAACRRVDELQFQHLEDRRVDLAATAFVDALWAKDDVEFPHLQNGGFDQEGLADADWSPVRREFRKRAAIVGMDQEYAVLKTTAWRRHKTGGDYVTPFLHAQLHEMRAALQDPDHPHKPKHGQSGPGPEAVRWLLGVELHDMHTETHWMQAKQAMVPYYVRILSAHGREYEPTDVYGADYRHGGVHDDD